MTRTGGSGTTSASIAGMLGLMFWLNWDFTLLVVAITGLADAMLRTRRRLDVTTPQCLRRQAVRHHLHLAAGQHLRLGLGVEVHQGVAADQQVDARDRGVLDQVVPAEDDRPSELLVEGEPILLPVEVPLQELRGDVLDGARGDGMCTWLSSWPLAVLT